METVPDTHFHNGPSRTWISFEKQLFIVEVSLSPERNELSVFFKDYC